MAINGSELCFGLVLLLEAAQFHSANPVTPPSNRKRGSAALAPPPCPSKPAHCKPTPLSSLPLKKRLKRVTLDAGDTSVGTWPGSPSRSIVFRPAKKTGKCSKGSAHRMWELAEESAMTAVASADRFNTLTTFDSNQPQKDTNVASEKIKTFVLYEKDDDKHINALHNVVRRDIWEGFLVTSDTADEDAPESSNARRSGRLARYDGTIGFRCRFCKNVPFHQRAEKSAVYPRSLERIYLANIRFQRDHVEHCTFIPSEIKETYARLKDTKGLSRGRKQYWVSSALRRGLCNGENGIVFSSDAN